MNEYTFTMSSDAKKEELTQHRVGLFASVSHGAPIKASLHVGSSENVSVSCWGAIGGPASGLKAVIESDTTSVEGGAGGVGAAAATTLNLLPF